LQHTKPNKQAIQGGGLPEDAVQIPAKAVEVFEKYLHNLTQTGFSESWNSDSPWTLGLG
jgi:hypothetical protein